MITACEGHTEQALRDRNNDSNELDPANRLRRSRDCTGHRFGWKCQRVQCERSFYQQSEAKTDVLSLLTDHIDSRCRWTPNCGEAPLTGSWPKGLFHRQTYLFSDGSPSCPSANKVADSQSGTQKCSSTNPRRQGRSPLTVLCLLVVPTSGNRLC